MLSITIDDRGVRKSLSRLASRLADLGPALHDIGEDLSEGTRSAIEQGRDWSGRPFAPNSPATLARKRGSQPLIATGSFLARRIHYEVEGGRAVLIGASGIQAAVLQFGAARGAFGKTRRGSPIPWGPIPPRPYLPLGDDRLSLPERARRRILEIISRHLSAAAPSDS